MIDLHSHILAGLDDGAADVSVSLEMARLAVADGITHMACTPHILDGRYPNSRATIMPATNLLQAMLVAHKIPLKLYTGADVHIAWDLPKRLASGEVPTLNHSRYFLLEPPHEILPPKLEDLASRLIAAGFVPIITHPERLRWIKGHFDVVRRLADMGCPLQLTAGSILGDFGPWPKECAERIVAEGRAAIFASDAHSAKWRTPVMSQAYKIVTGLVGEPETEKMFRLRPAAILANAEPSLVMGAVRRNHPTKSGRARGLFGRIFSDG